MFHRFRVILFVGVLLVIGGAIVWYLRLQFLPTPDQSAATVSNKLTTAEYQSQVADILGQVAAAPSDSLPAAVAAAVARLQSLVVSDEVKYDHLTLFTAFDLWARQQPASGAMIKAKFQKFVERQVWSAQSIQALAAKLPSS